MPSWKLSEIEEAKTILGRYSRSHINKALAKIGQQLGRNVTEEALNKVLAQRKLPDAASYCTPDKMPEDVEKLVKLTRKNPLSFSDLCNRLDLSPTKAEALIKKARALGVKIHVENNHVGLPRSWYEDRIHDTLTPAPAVGDVQRVAVISDLHLGSKFCLREALRHFIENAHKQGIREVLCPGDVLDGIYGHGRFELTHTGLDAQARDLYEVLPQYPGMTYHMITGNHDYTFTETCGLSVGEYLTNYFKERGRQDLNFYGDRSAFLKIRGAIIHLWHPRSGVSYAKSYPLQKIVEKYTSAEKPNILLAGHWHTFCNVYEREVHAVACPTFQGGGSAFSKSLGGAPAIGGLILSWQLTAQGTLRPFGVEMYPYPERELFQALRGTKA